MIKAVLLDLDDTLLTNPINKTGDSIEAWDTFFNARLGIENAGAGLLAGIIAVSTNTNPVENNLDVYLKATAQQWKIPEADVMQHFLAFYDEVYDRMQSQVAPRESAPVLIEWLKNSGYEVVIATNPLFTADGVARRLEWAGLPRDFGYYSLVTHIENMQFAKPTPHYYEEIIGRLGIASDEALMVGDDWDNDIVPAEKAGLNTYWIRPDGSTPGKASATPDGQGTLNDFTLRTCNLGFLDTLQPRPLRAEMLVPRLLGNVGALFGLLRAFAPDYWRVHSQETEWSPLEVVCHLRDSEAAVQRMRLETILAEDNPFLSAAQTPPGPGQFSPVENYCDPAEEFAAERQKTVALLKDIPSEAWLRPARHSIFGPTTLLEMANFTATHDRLHLQQICQSIGDCR